MNNQFDYTIVDMIENAVRNMKLQPLYLAGPPAGIVGQLAQTNVLYDIDELASSGYVSISGMSLLDNMNHIRYRIGLLESGVVPLYFTDLLDVPGSYVGDAGMAVVVNATEDGLEFAVISGGTGHVIEYSGSPQTARSNLNFTGNVIVTDDSLNDRTTVTVQSGVSNFTDLSDVNPSYSGSAGLSVVVNASEDGLDYTYITPGHEIKGPDGLSVTQEPWLQFDGAVSVTDVSGVTHVLVSGGGGSGASAFTDLTDVLDTYSGSAGYAVVVNGAETGLVFSGIAGGGGYTPPATTQINDFQMGNGSGSWIKKTLAETRLTLMNELANSYNYIINGGFDFAQRQVPATLTTIADNGYSADRWRVTRENADVQYARVDATGESGLTSKYYGQFKKITNTGKMHVCQILESMNSISLRDKVVTFQIKMKASSAKTIRMAILELQTAGTADSIPATLVTAFGANGTDPTLGANVAIIGGALSKSVTTTWTAYSITVSVPSNSKNIICAVWTDSQFAANDILSLAEADCFVGSTTYDANPKAWTPRLMAQEMVLCHRYCRAWTSAQAQALYFQGFAVSTTQANFVINFTQMFAIPSLVAVAGDWKVSDGVTDTDVTTLAVIATALNSEASIYFKAVVASGLTQFRTYVFIADGTANRLLYLSAEL
jgi:hypothetical protein